MPKATAPARAIPDPAKSKPPKPVRFWGSSLKDLRSFPPGVRQDCGYQIDKVQRGGQPDSVKPLAIVGKGVEEIIVNDDDGWFRVMYAARLEDAVHVLHAFQKKTNQTSPRDIELGQKRYKELVESRQRKAAK